MVSVSRELGPANGTLINGPFSIDRHTLLTSLGVERDMKIEQSPAIVHDVEKKKRGRGTIIRHYCARIIRFRVIKTLLLPSSTERDMDGEDEVEDDLWRWHIKY